MSKKQTHVSRKQKRDGLRLMDLPEDLAERGREVWLAGLGAVATVEEEGTKLYDELVARGRKFEKEGSALYGRLVRRGQTVEARGRRRIASARQDLDKQQKRWSDQVEEAVYGVVERTLRRIDVPTRSEVRNLSKQVDLLASKIDRLSGVMAKEASAAEGPQKSVYHVVPHDEGWSVKPEGGDRAISVHPTKDEAVARARELAKNREPSRVVIHKQDGRIQQMVSFPAD